MPRNIVKSQKNTVSRPLFQQFCMACELNATGLAKLSTFVARGCNLAQHCPLKSANSINPIEISEIWIENHQSILKLRCSTTNYRHTAAITWFKTAKNAVHSNLTIWAASHSRIAKTFCACMLLQLELDFTFTRRTPNTSAAGLIYEIDLHHKFPINKVENLWGG